MSVSDGTGVDADTWVPWRRSSIRAAFVKLHAAALDAE